MATADLTGALPDLSSAGDLVNRFSKALDVPAGNTSDRYSAVFGSVDGVLEGISIGRRCIPPPLSTDLLG